MHVVCRPLVLLLVFTAGLRTAWVAAQFSRLASDPDGYTRLAEGLVRERTFAWLPNAPGQPPAPSAFRPPLYPLLLTGCVRQRSVSRSLVAALHVLLGVATVGLTVLVGRAWGLNRAAIAAGLLVACDPILLNQSAQVMTETLAAFLAMLALWQFTRFNAQRTPRNAALAGSALALAVLCRPAFLAWLMLAAVAMVLLHGDWRQRLANTAAIVFAAVVVLSPWTLRNYFVLGQPVITTTHGGYTLWLGNHPEFYAYLRGDSRLPYEVDGEPVPNVALPSEIEIDRYWQGAAVRNIRNDPTGFARACLYRWRRFWGVLPMQLHETESPLACATRYAVAVWYTLFWLCAIVGAWRVRRELFQSPWLWGLLLVIALSGLHLVYWTDMRMRAPLMPFLALLVASGMCVGRALLPVGIESTQPAR